MPLMRQLRVTRLLGAWHLPSHPRHVRRCANRGIESLWCIACGSGKTYDYKVLYTNVSALYLLPKQDGHHMALSVSLARWQR